MKRFPFPCFSLYFYILTSTAQMKVLDLILETARTHRPFPDDYKQVDIERVCNNQCQGLISPPFNFKEMGAILVHGGESPPARFHATNVLSMRSENISNVTRNEYFIF